METMQLYASACRDRDWPKKKSGFIVSIPCNYIDKKYNKLVFEVSV